MEKDNIIGAINQAIQDHGKQTILKVRDNIPGQMVESI
jgi:hypothetical protein